MSFNNVNLVGSTVSRTVEGSGKTVTDLIINNNLMNYVATDDLAGHTNATVTRSRILNNKTT